MVSNSVGDESRTGVCNRPATNFRRDGTRMGRDTPILMS